MGTRSPLSVWSKLALSLEVLGGYVKARRLLRSEGIREVLAALRSGGRARPGPGGDPVVAGRRLGRAVTRTLAWIPGDSRCLTQSLVLTRLLAVRGIDSTMVIGVSPGERFAAHAWVELGGAALLPAGGDEFDELVRL
jgi:hypothetical protein